MNWSFPVFLKRKYRKKSVKLAQKNDILRIVSIVKFYWTFLLSVLFLHLCHEFRVYHNIILFRSPSMGSPAYNDVVRCSIGVHICRCIIYKVNKPSEKNNGDSGCCRASIVSSCPKSQRSQGRLWFFHSSFRTLTWNYRFMMIPKCTGESLLYSVSR